MCYDPKANLLSAFPIDGATPTGSLLFGCSGAPWSDGLVTWAQVADHFSDIADESLIFSMSGEDFRYYFPGFVLGLIRQEQDDGSPLGSYVFADLYSYASPEHWDSIFIERWCRFIDSQYQVLEYLLKDLLTLHLGTFNGEIAYTTFQLAHIFAGQENRPSDQIV